MTALLIIAPVITGGVWFGALHIAAIDMKLSRIARALEERNRRG